MPCCATALGRLPTICRRTPSRLAPPLRIAANAAEFLTGLPGTSRAMTGWGVFVSYGAGRSEWDVFVRMTNYRQGRRVNCIPARRSRMDKPNNGENTNNVILAAPVSSFPPKVGVMNNVAKRKKSPGAIFRERSEPAGRVSGMIRANPG